MELVQLNLLKDHYSVFKEFESANLWSYFHRKPEVPHEKSPVVGYPGFIECMPNQIALKTIELIYPHGQRNLIERTNSRSIVWAQRDRTALVLLWPSSSAVPRRPCRAEGPAVRSGRSRNEAGGSSVRRNSGSSGSVNTCSSDISAEPAPAPNTRARTGNGKIIDKNY